MAKKGDTQHQHKPPGIRIVKGEPLFLKELETIMKSCFRPSEIEGNVQEQMMSRLPFAYVQAVNVAISYTFYGKTRTEISEKLDHYRQRLSDAVHAIMQQQTGKPLPKKKLEKLNNEVWLATDHIERAEIAHGAFTKSGGRPIDWFRRCLLMECFHAYAVVTGKLPTQVPGEAWHVIAWMLQNYYKTHTVRDPLADNAPDITVRQSDVFYLQHAWHRGNRQDFPKDTLKDWPKAK